MNAKYVIGATIAIPLLPLLYYQGKRIRSSVPKLPEATGVEGLCPSGSKRVLRLLSIGESTIAGVGVKTHAEGFTGTLGKEIAKKLNVNVAWKVYARSGYTAKKVTKKIVPKITWDKADIIVIGLGGNDAFTLNNPSEWRKDIYALIEGLHAKFGNIPIIFTNMPPIKEFPAFTPLIKFTIGNLVEILGNELNKVTANRANVYYSAQKITLADWIGRLSPNATPSDFFSDGVHPSKLTYQFWAKDIADFIVDNDEIVNSLYLDDGNDSNNGNNVNKG